MLLNPFEKFADVGSSSQDIRKRTAAADRIKFIVLIPEPLHIG